MYAFKNILFLQIRSPISSSKLFSEELTQWIESSGVKEVVILSSANASWCVDQFLQEEQYVNFTTHVLGQCIEQLQRKPIHGR